MDNQAVNPQPDSVKSPPASYRIKAPHSGYTIYLLTVWFDEGQNAGDPASWRFRLENPRTKEAKGFAGLAMLVKGLTDAVRSENATRWQSQNSDDSIPE